MIFDSDHTGGLGSAVGFQSPAAAAFTATSLKDTIKAKSGAAGKALGGEGQKEKSFKDTVWIKRLKVRADAAKRAGAPLGHKIIATQEMGLPAELVNGVLGDGVAYGVPCVAMAGLGQ